MEDVFNIIENVNPNKIPFTVREKFAKLTLSSRKKPTTPAKNDESDSDSEKHKENVTARKNKVSRSLLRELLTDDESENEVDSMNRLFLSRQSQKTIAIEKNSRCSAPFTEKLEFSDSDVTNCSDYKSTNTSLNQSANYDGENEQKTEIKQLHISEADDFDDREYKESESLFSTENDNQQQNNSNDAESMKILSVQVQQLAIKSPQLIDERKRTAEADTLSATTISSLSIENENKRNSILCPLTPTFPPKPTSGNDDTDSVYTVDSSDATSNKSVTIPETDDETEEIIVISDSDESERSFNVQISDIKPSAETLPFPSMQENERANRLQEFLDNIPPVRPGIESSSQMSVPYSSVRRFKNDLKEENESLVEDSIELAETSLENEKSDIENRPEYSKNITGGDKQKPENQTPKTPKPDKSSNTSSQNAGVCIEQINISAKIKIKFHLKEPVIVYSADSPEKGETDQEATNEENEKSHSKSEAETTNKYDCDDESQRNTVDFERPTKSTPVMSENDADSVGKSEEQFQIDDMAKNLLTKLYGNEWQTPEVIKKLDGATSISKRQDESGIGNFTNFDKNILPDLHSTKLRQNTFTRDILDDSANFKKPIAQVKPMVEKIVDPKSDVKSKNGKTGQKIKTKPDRFRKSSSSSNSESENQSEFDSDTDVSWKESATSHSDSLSDDDLPKKHQKTTKKKSAKGIIYLDLTDDCVKVQKDHKTPIVDNDATFTDRLNKLLETCQYKEKPKLPGTPQTTVKPKRKLFTPRYDEDEIETNVDKYIKELESSPTYKNADDNEEDSVKLKYLLPPSFQLYNKQIESVKSATPISKIKTLKGGSGSGRKKPPSDKNPSNEISESNEKISTSKSCNQNIPAPNKIAETPIDKYGFLRSLDVTISKHYCHAEALYYKENFKSKKDELGQKLYALYNEKVFDNKLDVNITWNKKLLTTAGRCFNKKVSGGRSSRIELSEKVITSADRLRCTLIHEMCHAATWVFNAEHGHNATWKRWANKANKIFPELPNIGVCHKYDIEYKYTYKCTLCQAKSYAHSKSKKTENIRCSYCHGAIEVYLNRKDKDGNIMHTPVREPRGFAKFVKENYKQYKTPDRKHADVMKILSNKFASLNVKEKK